MIISVHIKLYSFLLYMLGFLIPSNMDLSSKCDQFLHLSEHAQNIAAYIGKVDTTF